LATLFGHPAAERNTLAGLLETVGLTPSADIPAAKLSHGEKQRLEWDVSTNRLICYSLMNQLPV